MTFENSVIQLVAGMSHTCALLVNYSVKCWGANGNEQLGLNDQNNRFFPETVTGLGSEARSLVAGRAYTCAILNDDSVKCWGHNSSGQLGFGSHGNRIGFSGSQIVDLGTRELVKGLSVGILGTSVSGRDLTAQSLAAGYEHTCAILDDNKVKCWGENGNGQLGIVLDGSKTKTDAASMGNTLLHVPLVSP